MAHSRARQDAKRRENMDAKQLTEQTPAGCRVSRGAEPAARSPEGSAAMAHSRVRQDAKRRENMDAKQLTEKRLSAVGRQLFFKPLHDQRIVLAAKAE